MIYLRLFLNFLMIGALSFGGGYGMVSLVRERVLSNGWLTENEFLNFIAVSESTPGPLAVNMATFIGSTQGGILGSFVATLGVVLPSFLIILLIASALKNLMKYAPVNAFLSGVRPCVVAMILATALSMALSTLFGLTDLQAGFAPDLRSIANSDDPVFSRPRNLVLVNILAWRLILFQTSIAIPAEPRLFHCI